ncbi:MAG: diaminopimelate epimerase [Eggerthellaceae bacterium]|nr:diaminopimelate epimerase [Eggerthellaceae bacterium]
MRIEFVKMHGLGNDFILIDDFSQDIDLTCDQVVALCDRHFGIGADGVILVKPPANAGSLAYMHYINADGSLSAMCGNGIRCFAKYLVDRGYVSGSERRFVADTLAGPKPISFEADEDELLTYATVNMGVPLLSPESIPTTLAANALTEGGEPFVKESLVPSPWGLRFTLVSMGNPHAVCFVDDWESMPDELFKKGERKGLGALDLGRIGPDFECSPVFPERANITFACVEADGIRLRVFERGCGETYACGTGACATSVAACLTGRAGFANDLFLLGGTLKVSWDGSGDVFMSGPAAEAFSGSIEIE